MILALLADITRLFEENVRFLRNSLERALSGPECAY